MKKVFLSAFILGFVWVLIAKPPKKNTTSFNENTWVENKTIFGKWIWFKTECCGKTKGVTTPATFGDTIILELIADNTFAEKANKYRVARTGKIVISKVNKNEKTFNTIQFNDERPAHYFLSSNGDTLVLSWEHLELQKEYYYRKK